MRLPLISAIRNGYNAGMGDIYQLPIPDWGLICPWCSTPLAGLEEHRCEHCGRRLNMVTLLAVHRPIPDIDLTCPGCDYSLTGLTGNRCPECGQQFSVADLLREEEPSRLKDIGPFADPPDHHLKRRDPMFTGAERPLPEFGMTCLRCERSLAGATLDVCPHCGAHFRIEEMLSPRDWISISGMIPSGAAMFARQVLYSAQIPYLLTRSSAADLYTALGSSSGDILVPREFQLDAMHALATADLGDGTETADAEPWICPACAEPVPGNFEICWSCETPRPSLGIEQGETGSSAPR